MSMTVVFAMMAAASAVETGANMKGLHPDFRDTFRNDATLGFMRNQLRREDPFAEAQQGPAYDSKKAQKAAAGVAKDNQQEAQPGPDNVLKKAQKAAAKEQEQAQQGPNHDSKEAQKAAAKVAKDNQQEAQEAPNLDAAEAQKAAAKEQEEAQQGPSYDSKEAQKAAAKVAKDNQPKAVSVKDPVQVVSDGVKTADKFLDKLAGTGASQKQAKKSVASHGKDASSVSGCTDFPQGWEDSRGNDCEDYDEGHFCDRRGGEDEGWLDEWGTLESVANKGFSATQACCVCGGGHREFQVNAAGPSPAAAPSPASPAALQSQGFSGKLVEHVEGETMTGDWGREFGPKAGHRDFKSICKDFLAACSWKSRRSKASFSLRSRSCSNLSLKSCSR